ncbi:MAG: TolC family protein, partial [Aquificae bacterium]|nr:TolC family protein [Aquificota bacterium]
TWISSFLPTVSYNFSYTKNRHTDPDSFSRSHSLNVFWNIYDSGASIFNKKILKYNYFSSKESFKENILDIFFDVKYAYIKCAASKEIVKFRKTQLKAAKLNLDVAKRKKELGLVKKSDVLQAQVRYENAKYALEQAKNQYKKNLAELNSWLGYPLDNETEINIDDFFFYADDIIPPFQEIEKIAFEKRPLLKQYESLLKVSKYTVKKSLASFTPSISFSFSRTKFFNSLYWKNQYTNTYRISLNWNIFTGFQRYYTYLSAKENEKGSKFSLLEAKRTLKLRLYKTYTDLKTAIARLKVAKSLLEEANLNYKQALGEYKVGTGDILSLIRAEESLASAHETYINSLLDIAISKITLERQMGIKSIREVMKLSTSK